MQPVTQQEISASHLSQDFQRSLPSILSADCELGRLVDHAASFLQAWTVGLHLQTHSRGSVCIEVMTSHSPVLSQYEATHWRVFLFVCFLIIMSNF